jgi:exonuclease III
MPRESSGLKIASHNVRGLGNGRYGPNLPVKLIALSKIWLAHRLDIVCLQETHVLIDGITRVNFHLSRAAEMLGGCGWDTFWTPAVSSRSCGVAILIRSSLVASGTVQVGRPIPHTTGRLLILPIQWGSHSFKIVNIYVPVDSRSQQRVFITSYLKRVAAAPGKQIWCGDYNFVRSAMDCLNGSHGADHTIADHFDAECPHLMDSFRYLHPTQRTFTRVCNSSAARLDRILLSPTLLPYVAKAYITSG